LNLQDSAIVHTTTIGFSEMSTAYILSNRAVGNGNPTATTIEYPSTTSEYACFVFRNGSINDLC